MELLFQCTIDWYSCELPDALRVCLPCSLVELLTFFLIWTQMPGLPQDPGDSGYLEVMFSLAG